MIRIRVDTSEWQEKECKRRKITVKEYNQLLLSATAALKEKLRADIVNKKWQHLKNNTQNLY